jgi:ferric-dicitrate binding protein FerR (iron transport regulator)
LGDSTVVTLNAGSRLIFPSFFTGKTREVTLLGEAFFIVTKNREMPFVVKAGSLDIKVLGTEFNISAYPEENIIQTVLKEGSVSVRKNTAGIFEKELYLKPSQMAVYDKNAGETEISEVDVEEYTIWTQGILRFDQMDLSRIIKRMERYYNLRIDYENPLDGTIKISGKLDLARDKDEVFEYLAKVSGNRIEKTSDKSYIIR